jgi:hypothetical protein
VDKLTPEVVYLAALQEIYALTKNGTRLPVHGKAKIATIVKKAIYQAKCA